MTPKGSKMEQKGPKVGPKGSKMKPKGPNMEPKERQKEPKGDQRGVKREAKIDQNASKGRYPEKGRKLDPGTKFWTILGVIFDQKRVQKSMRKSMPK